MGWTSPPALTTIAAVLTHPPKLVKALGLPLICVAMFAVAGGHWALLQTVAWSQMLWSYSQASGSVVDGAKKTFSGEYPCAMCKKVAEGRQKEDKAPATVKLDKKAEAFLAGFGGHLRVPPPGKAVYFSFSPGVQPERSDAPPSPPPRLS